ncbi:glycogen synthase [Phaeacidiphilus oryzae]|uniref:glycogen synthase n=1 Tax=Phaeacidiphilus oryzae TaxID=348818 RepID=UPI002AFE69AF|nr:glycogen synthase [Phaeacidiphilus oryzae]
MTPPAGTDAERLRIGLLTREYPPSVYGGAGVHVEFLARALRSLVDLRVHCWAEPDAKPPAEPDATPHTHAAALDHADLALRVLSTDLTMVDAVAGAQLVHSHTWYANLAGHVAKLLHGVPHVMTAHSLEPLRPWKAEELRGGYAVSRWIERTAVESADAVIAVSEGMRRDLVDCYPALADRPDRVHVVHNGIDTRLFRPVPETDALRRHGIDPERPTVLFVGRITRQKGVPHLLRAAKAFDPGVQLVLCAGAPDSKALDEEFRALAGELRRTREHVFWIPEMLPRAELVQFLSQASVFVCPSVYEPLGIVNLEAMACGTAVVASDVGGIPEVVEDGRTGLLVPCGEPAAFEAGLAEAVGSLIGDPGRAAEFGRAGRERAVARFGWDAIAARTVAVYHAALAVAGGAGGGPGTEADTGKGAAS